MMACRNRKPWLAIAAMGIALCCGSAPLYAAALSQPAQQALKQAQADIKDAKAQDALWTPAQAALKNAQKAAAAGDSEAVVKFSKKASEMAKLGIAQTHYPMVH
jgi:murein lipoprotein